MAASDFARAFSLDPQPMRELDYILAAATLGPAGSGLAARFPAKDFSYHALGARWIETIAHLIHAEDREAVAAYERMRPAPLPTLSAGDHRAQDQLRYAIWNKDQEILTDTLAALPPKERLLALKGLAVARVCLISGEAGQRLAAASGWMRESDPIR